MGAVNDARAGAEVESDVPATYEEYAAQSTRSDPRFTDWLRERSEPTWTDATEHPFTRELGAGTLSEDAYAEYLVQDYAFVDDLVGTFGYAVGQAPDMASKRPLVEFLDTITDEENDYFERSFDALEVPESRRRDPKLAEPTAAFVDLLGRAAGEGGYAETLAVLVPAEWIYEEWATAVAAEYADANADPPSAGADLPSTTPSGSTSTPHPASASSSTGSGRTRRRRSRARTATAGEGRTVVPAHGRPRGGVFDSVYGTDDHE